MAPRQQVLITMQTLENGTRKSRALAVERAEFRAKQFRDPEVCFQHPKDGLIKTTLDAALIRAVEGGTHGAWRELKAEGYGDIADTIRKGGL